MKAVEGGYLNWFILIHFIKIGAELPAPKCLLLLFLAEVVVEAVGIGPLFHPVHVGFGSLQN